MSVHFKIRAPLLAHIREDLERRHPFAYERVGFMYAALSRIGQGALTLLVQSYTPVEDDDYVKDRSVGAMMGSEAIRKALQHSYNSRTAVLHVHMHAHEGRPSFSGVDLSENARFVPNFFNVSAHTPHGAIVLSQDNANGQLWLSRNVAPVPVTRFSAIGAPLWCEGERS